MCEPLRGKVKHSTGITLYPYNGRQVYLNEDVKSAVAFYKKYKDKEWTFLTDFKCHGNKELDWRFTKYDEFNDWLLDYCFGDVIE